MSTKSDLEAAIEVRDAAHAAWLAAASPRSERTVLISDAKMRAVHAAWDKWAAACRRVGELEEAIGTQAPP